MGVKVKAFWDDEIDVLAQKVEKFFANNPTYVYVDSSIAALPKAKPTAKRGRRFAFVVYRING